MDFEWTEEQQEIRNQVRALCERFPDEYWRDRDTTGEFPWDFYKAVADGGWLGITIPREYGGAGLGITEAAIVMQTVGESGGGTQACSAIHLGIFGLEPLIKYGTEAMKKKYLPDILAGTTHVSFAVTEPDAGTNTTEIKTFATRRGDGYSITGRKVFITKAQESQKMLLLTRTTPIEHVEKKTDGMTLFFADIDREAVEVRELHKCGRPRDRHQHVVHRQPLRSARRPCRRGGQGASATSSTASTPSASWSPPNASAWASARSSAPSATPRSAWCFTGRSA